MNTDLIKLTIPAKAQYLLTARLASSSIGSRINMTIGDIEDLKTAIEEACIIVISTGVYNDIYIEYKIENNSAECMIKGINKGESNVFADLSVDLSQYILEATTSELEIHEKEGAVDYVKFTKQGI